MKGYKRLYVLNRECFQNTCDQFHARLWGRREKIIDLVESVAELSSEG